MAEKKRKKKTNNCTEDTTQKTKDSAIKQTNNKIKTQNTQKLLKTVKTTDMRRIQQFLLQWGYPSNS